MTGSGNDNSVAILKTYNGRMLAGTGNNSGSQVFSTPAGPSIDYIVPSSGPYGTVLSIRGHDFLVARGNGRVDINGVPPESVVSWTDTEIVAVVPPEATTGPVTVTTRLGTSNPVVFTTSLSRTWHFAEGTTRDNAVDGSYEQWITVQNPNEAGARVTLTYMMTDGSTKLQPILVAPNSRQTVNVNAFLGKDVDASTLVQSDQPVLAERPMYFNYRNKWTGGHTVIGVPVPRKDYYFAEGSTRDNASDGQFEEWLCLQNPGSTDATVTVTYMLETGQNVQKEYAVGKTSRRTVDVNLELGADHDVSAVVHSSTPIVAERPMYFNYRNKWTGGHDTVGAPGPDTVFYLAEGTTRNNTTDGAFDEWITIQNPGSADAAITLNYYTTAGVQTQDITVPKKSRQTVDVKLRLGPDVDSSCKVVSSVPVLVERPMYFNYRNSWNGGHDVMGCPAPKNAFYFAEGNTLSEFSTWVAVMNTGNSRANVTFDYMLSNGTRRQAKAAVEPGQRYTRSVLEDVGLDKNFSLRVSSDQQIVAERPMYFNYHGWCTGGSDTVGYGL
jgi:hypothetical protein